MPFLHNPKFFVQYFMFEGHIRYFIGNFMEYQNILDDFFGDIGIIVVFLQTK